MTAELQIRIENNTIKLLQGLPNLQNEEHLNVRFVT